MRPNALRWSVPILLRSCSLKKSVPMPFLSKRHRDGFLPAVPPYLLQIFPSFQPLYYYERSKVPSVIGLLSSFHRPGLATNRISIRFILFIAYFILPNNTQFYATLQLKSFIAYSLNKSNWERNFRDFNIYPPY